MSWMNVPSILGMEPKSKHKIHLFHAQLIYMAYVGLNEIIIEDVISQLLAPSPNAILLCY